MAEITRQKINNNNIKSNNVTIPQLHTELHDVKKELNNKMTAYVDELKENDTKLAERLKETETVNNIQFVLISILAIIVFVLSIKLCL